jgi:flagellar biosynthesis protein FlhG
MFENRLTNQQGSSVTLRRHAEGATPQGAPAIVSVVSGKGGVGKSVIAYNVAIAAGRNGIKTLLVDMNWRLGSLHILANANVTHGMEHVVSDHGYVRDAVVSIGQNAFLLASASVSGASDWPPRERLVDFIANCRETLQLYDLILIDTPSGIHEQVATVVSLSDDFVLTLNPEITSIADGYGMYKWLLSHKLRSYGSLLINRVSGIEEAKDVTARFNTLCERFLGKKPLPLGFLQEDHAVSEAIARQRSVFSGTGTSIISSQISALTGQLSARLFKNRTVSAISTIDTSAASAINSEHQLSDNKE